MEQLVGGKWGDSIFFTPCESQHDTLSLSIKEMVGSPQPRGRNLLGSGEDGIAILDYLT